MDSLTSRFQKEVFYPYLELLKSKYRFHLKFEHAKKNWEAKLTEEELVNGPYLEKSQAYESGIPLNKLGLHEKTSKTIRKKLGGRDLWKHQTDAIELLLGKKNVAIATGTSSGKTLCYQIPILDDLLTNPSLGLRAIIIYPLNALVNDQLREWELMLKDHPEITFARFTGQTPTSQEDYEGKLKDVIRTRLIDEGLTQHDLERKTNQKLKEALSEDSPNRLNHREAIRANPPHVLITNFSMLEYLLERPVDAPIFENARLNFLVLDEAHAYRGIQATEIAFLIRRLKDRLGLEKLTCIATSATLGKQNDIESLKKVRKFVSTLFCDDFAEPNPIYGTLAEPVLKQPSYSPTPNQYVRAAEVLRKEKRSDLRPYLGIKIADHNLASLLEYDGNLYRLRKEILKKPIRLEDAAKLLWPDETEANNGLQALLEITAEAKTEGSNDDLLPTRLHYFVRAQDGFYICLHMSCPGRNNEKPTFYVSRKNISNIPEGDCPECYQVGQKSKLVEVVSCRKCGYLFGALQDKGPRRAQNTENEDNEIEPHFDSFDTELGWMADSYWSYFSVEDELPFPRIEFDEDDDDQEDIFRNPAKLNWCVICGKKSDEGEGDNCICENPHLREIKVFHRQCPYSRKAIDRDNLYKQVKTPLTSCPNCGARNGSGMEPVQRFQESDDETGLAMAIPLAHFQVSPQNEKQPRKLLCFEL